VDTLVTVSTGPAGVLEQAPETLWVMVSVSVAYCVGPDMVWTTVVAEPGAEIVEYSVRTDPMVIVATLVYVLGASVMVVSSV